MPWVRLWCDILDSPKLFDLSDDLFRGWMLILLCTKKADRGGRVPSPKTLAFWTRRDIETVNGWIGDLLDAGLLDRDGGGFIVHDWEFWQPPRDRTNGERQRRHREAKKVSPSEPPSSKDSDTEAEAEAEAAKTVTDARVSRNRNGVTVNLGSETIPITPNPPTPTLFQSNWGPDQQAVVQLALERWGASNGDAVIGDFLRDYPAPWVRAAIDRAWDKLGQDLRPAYIRGILRGFQRDGGPKQVSKGPVAYKPTPIAAVKPDRPPPVDDPIPPEEAARMLRAMTRRGVVQRVEKQA
jgi:hypothetical protein